MATDIHPADNTAFTRPLIRGLRRLVDTVTQGLPDLPDERRLPVAGAWVYTTVLVAWCEDHSLIDPWLRPAAAPQRTVLDDVPDGWRLWLAHAALSLSVHPATRCLTDPLWTPIRESTPDERACRAIVDYWSSAPSLAYPDPERGPASISGWIAGDLLQAVTDERRKANALCQTPWWVADFLHDLTLRRAVDEYRDEPVISVIDPTCGTGHMLIRAVDYLWEWYTTGTLSRRQSSATPITGGTPVEPGEAIRRILAGVTGIELDPLTTAVARLRMVVAAGELMHRSGLLPTLRLDTIPPDIRPRVMVADSLLAGQIPWHEYAALYPQHAAIYGNPTSAPAGWPQPEQAVPAQRGTGQLDLFGEVAA